MVRKTQQKSYNASDTEEVMLWLGTATDRLVRELDPERVLLFGSYARHTATRRSDIDLCVVLETDMTPLDRIGTILKLLKDAPRPVEAVAYTPAEMSRIDSPFIRRILEEGEVLYERGKAVA